MPCRARSLPLQPLTESVRFAVVLWGEPSSEARQRLACPVLSFDGVLERGAGAVGAFQPAQLAGDDVATLVYTSGTTGHPKVCRLGWSGVEWCTG